MRIVHDLHTDTHDGEINIQLPHVTDIEIEKPCLIAVQKNPF